MWIKRLGESVFADEKDAEVPSGVDGADGGGGRVESSSQDSLDLGDWLDKARAFGSKLVEAANESVLNGTLGSLLAPEFTITEPLSQPRGSIAVVGLGDTSDDDDMSTEALGRWIAMTGHNLITLGGAGKAALLSRGFVSVKERKGIAVGLIPCDVGNDFASPPGFPNPYVELPLRTPVGAGTVNFYMDILSADVVISLSGLNSGSEISFALQQNKPVIVYQPGAPADQVMHLEIPVAKSFSELELFLQRSQVMTTSSSSSPSSSTAAIHPAELASPLLEAPHIVPALRSPSTNSINNSNKNSSSSNNKNNNNNNNNSFVEGSRKQGLQEQTPTADVAASNALFTAPKRQSVAQNKDSTTTTTAQQQQQQQQQQRSKAQLSQQQQQQQEQLRQYSDDILEAINDVDEPEAGDDFELVN